jgi:hypothetical protein
MATYQKFECFTETLAEKKHNLDTDLLNLYLSNDAPVPSTDTVKTDVVEITIENGYTGPEDITNATSRSGGVTSITAVDVVITASGGTVGPFRYVPVYNETAAADDLVCWWDYGSAVTLNDSESFTVDFGTEMCTIT